MIQIKLINPISRIHSTGINHQLRIDKPQAGSFRQNQNNNSDNRMNVYGSTKDMIQSFLITTSQFVGDKTLGSGYHGRVQKGEHNNHTTHNIVQSIIGNS